MNQACCDKIIAILLSCTYAVFDSIELSNISANFNYSLCKYCSLSHSVFKLAHDVLSFIMSHIYWQKQMMKMLVSILRQLYLTLWNFVGSQNAPHVSLFLITPPSKKIKTSFAAKVILRRCKQMGWHIYNIYIYTFILFSINNNVAPFTSKPKEEEFYIFYKTGEENNIFKCWKKLGKLSSSIYVSFAAMERSNILVFIWFCVTSQYVWFFLYGRVYLSLSRGPLCLFA